MAPDTINRIKHRSSIFRLPNGFVPGPNDVICGRGKTCYGHEGNLKLREMVRKKTKEYSTTKCKEEKSAIVTDIAEAIRRKSPNGGFVKKDSDGWYEVGTFLAREKISQAFRDLLHHSYKSSTGARRVSRRVQRKTLVVDNSRCRPTPTRSTSNKKQSCGQLGRDAADLSVGVEHPMSRSFQTGVEKLSQINVSPLSFSYSSTPYGKSFQDPDQELSHTPSSTEGVKWPFRDYHSLPDFVDICNNRMMATNSSMTTGHPFDSTLVPIPLPPPVSRESPLNEAARKLQAMGDINIDSFHEVVDDSTGIIDPVPLHRIFRHGEAWERRSAP